MSPPDERREARVYGKVVSSKMDIMPIKIEIRSV
jgi:hypothetical protein